MAQSTGTGSAAAPVRATRSTAANGLQCVNQHQCGLTGEGDVQPMRSMSPRQRQLPRRPDPGPEQGDGEERISLRGGPLEPAHRLLRPSGGEGDGTQHRGLHVLEPSAGRELVGHGGGVEAAGRSVPSAIASIMRNQGFRPTRAIASPSSARTPGPSPASASACSTAQRENAESGSSPTARRRWQRSRRARRSTPGSRPTGTRGTRSGDRWRRRPKLTADRSPRPRPARS